MWNFAEDLIKGKEMELIAMNVLIEDWFNLIQNPKKKEIDLIIIQKWIEIKFDEYAKYSWNFYLEFECNWKPSWLFREEELHLEYWGHSDWDNLYLLNGDKLKEWTSDLIEKCRNNKTNTHKWFRVIESWWNWWRTKWLLVPVQELANISDKIYLLNNN